MTLFRIIYYESGDNWSTFNLTDVDQEILATFPEGLEILTGNGLHDRLFSVVLEKDNLLDAFIEAYKIITEHINNK